MRYSHTRLSTWRRCRQKYFWSYVEYSRPGAEGGGRRSLGRVAGDGCHQAMAVYYGGASPDAAVRRAHRAMLVRGLRQGYSRQQIDRKWGEIERVLWRYFGWSAAQEQWREQRVGAPEVHLEIPLPRGDRVQAYVDLVVRVGGKVWLVEHKFVQEAKQEHLPLDAQITMYCLLYALVHKEYPAGVIFNQVRAWNGGVALKEPVRRTAVQRTQEGLKLAYRELVAQVGDVVAWHRAIEQADAIAEGRAAPLWGSVPRRDDLVYRTPTHDCHWDCDHYKRCLILETMGRDLGPVGAGYDDLEIVLDDNED